MLRVRTLGNQVWIETLEDDVVTNTIDCADTQEAERVVGVSNRLQVSLMVALAIVRQPKPLTLYMTSLPEGPADTLSMEIQIWYV